MLTAGSVFIFVAPFGFICLTATLLRARGAARRSAEAAGLRVQRRVTRSELLLLFTLLERSLPRS